MMIATGGEAKISARGAVNLPARVLRELGWKHGDNLTVTVMDGDHLVLSRRPDDVVERFAGSLAHLFPSDEDTIAYLDEERGSWEESDQRLDG